MNTSNKDLVEAEERTKLLNGAHGILSDANLRAKYDRELLSQPNAQTTESRKSKAKNEQEEPSYFPGVVPHYSDFFSMAAEFLRNPSWKPKDSGPRKEDREIAERAAQAQAALNVAEEKQLFKDWVPDQRPSTGVWRTRPYFS
ncbi:hypothetical protein BDU57DRAFT_535375 [Ampelomyces quisqualis]|uniref:J domain-containing protein n=1 Tax=Ampelomyces quisqualis TaxID=50730 RepID=A0A6A5R2Y1_AMPQU|nr:hypothetical protein BDU57DRAFT_535375 [Ampelomyces quisqualis]